jgi:hypothetical protein
VRRRNVCCHRQNYGRRNEKLRKSHRDLSAD